MNDALRISKKGITWGVVVTTILWSMGAALFVSPLVASAATVTLSAGDNIKGTGPAVYFYASNGKRYVYPHSREYSSWYKDFSNVKTVSDEQLASIEIGGNITHRPGTYLVKIQSDSKTYAVEPGGKLRWITSEDIAKSLYGANWAKMVRDVYDLVFKDYTKGTDLTSATYPDGALVKDKDGMTWHITGGAKHKVTSEGMTANGWQAKHVVATTLDLATYTSGADITSANASFTDTAEITAKGGAAAPTTPVATPTSTGTLTVAVTSDSPAAASVATAGNANFTKFTLSAAGGDVKVKSILVHREGLSANSSLENIKVTDDGGAPVGSIGSLNANSKALVSFIPSLTVKSGETKTYFIRAGVLSTAAAGNTAKLGFASKDDLTLEGGSVGGAFPMYGNLMTYISVTIGTVTVTGEIGGVSDVQPNVGDKNVKVTKFKVAAGSTEGFIVETISVLKAGSSALGDTANIELWSDTQNKSLGELAAWDSNGKATFKGLNIPIGKGNEYRFSVLLDVVGGTGGTTVNIDMTDGTDVMVIAKGDIYGFYITPTNGNSWGGTDATAGLGIAQTLRSVSLTISRSATTPPTGFITRADNQTLVEWAFDARGEDIKVTALTSTFTLGAAGWTATTTMISNIRLYDEQGNIVAGPKDPGTSSGATFTVAFTDTFVVPVGIKKYALKAKLGSTAPANGTVSASIAAAGDVTATSMRTNTSVTASLASQAGNTQTVRAAQLIVRTLSTPSAGDVVAGVTGYTWATLGLDASASGEGVRLNSLAVSNTGNWANIDNAALYGDLDANGSYETQLTDTVQPSTSTATNLYTFTLTKDLIVKKSGSSNVAIKGDLATGAAAGTIHTVSVAAVADVTASGVDSGATLATTDKTVSGAGQAQTVRGSGGVAVYDNGSPIAALAIAGASDVLFAKYRFTATTEDFVVSRIEFGTQGGSARGSDDQDSVKEIKLKYSKKDGTSATVMAPVGSATTTFDNLEVFVPKDGNANIEVYANLYGIGSGNSGDFGDRPTLDITNTGGSGVRAVGQGSGTALTMFDRLGTVTGTGAGTSAQFLYKSYPTVKNVTQTTTKLTNGIANDLYSYSVTANAAGSIAIKQFGFDVTMTDTATANTLFLGAFQLFRGSTDLTTTLIDIRSSTGGDLEATTDGTFSTSFVSSSQVYVQFTTEEVIPAGSTYTYTLRAIPRGFSTAANDDDAVATRMRANNTATTKAASFLTDEIAATTGVLLGLATGTGSSTSTVSSSLIWSDLSGVNGVGTVPHNPGATTGEGFDGYLDSSGDWTNAYLVPDVSSVSFWNIAT